MMARAVIEVRQTVIPHDPVIHREYRIKLMPDDRGLAVGGYHEGWRDAPPNYRGRITVSMDDEIKPMDGRFALGNLKFRIVEEQIWSNSYECVLDSRLAFLAIWDVALHHALMQIAWRIIATLRIWGVMKPAAHDLPSVAIKAGFPWRDIYVIDRIASLWRRAK